MQIKAFLPASLIEYPGHIADVVYVGECNFRCPFCYNVDLVLRPERLADIPSQRVLDRLAGRRGFVDGLALTGGEPTIQPGLLPFLERVRELGLAVKLDTNGYLPQVLRECLQRGLVDYVAMDIKSSFARYVQAAGVPVESKRLQQAIALLMQGRVDYEFRTTVVPGLVEVQDVEAIATVIAGASRYYLQCFRPGETVGWGREGPATAPSAELLQEMAERAAPHVQDVAIRGLGQEGDQLAHTP
jgi:pyruvate formate lyase activating enzyme